MAARGNWAFEVSRPCLGCRETSFMGQHFHKDADLPEASINALCMSDCLMGTDVLRDAHG